MGYYLEKDFKPFHKTDAPDLIPSGQEEEIKKMGLWLYDNINNAIYKMCFGKNKTQFQKGYDLFKQGMEALEKRLSNSRFIFGDCLTDSDIRLFSTLVRLDVDYGKYLNLDIHLVDYDDLYNYSKEIYQIQDVKKKIFFSKVCRKEFTQEDIKNVELMWNDKVDRSDKSKHNSQIFLK